MANVSVDSSLVRRFWSKVDVSESTDACWNWTAHVSGGYGRIRAFVDGKWKYQNANRISWLIHFSEIPTELFVCHKCDNKLCVNPNHLFLGTSKKNSEDMVSKNRQYRGERHWNAKLSESDVEKILEYGKQGLTQAEIASKFNVSRTNVCLILNNKTRKRTA